MSTRIGVYGACLALMAAAASPDSGAGGPIRDGQTGDVQMSKQVLTGRLEIIWHDSLTPGLESKHEVTLVDDAGRRHVLEPSKARKAAGDLYSLVGRRIAVSHAPLATKRAAGTEPLLQPDAIVPMDGLGVNGGVTSRAGNWSAKAVTGTNAWVSILCKFKDVAAQPKDATYFQSMYGNNPNQLDHYWREVSYDQYNLTGSTVRGWFTLPQNRSYYVYTNSSGKLIADLTRLSDDCIAAANSSVDFRYFYGINMMFNAQLNGSAYGGLGQRTLDGATRNWGTTWLGEGALANHSVIAHEMGHAFGLPHANNSDLDTDTYDNPWDVMSDPYNNAMSSPTYGGLAKHLNTYSRNRLGWIPAARKRTITHGSAAVSFTLQRASLVPGTTTQMVVLPVPGSSTRYYTVEARAKTGYYEGNLAGDAVIIHSVDSTRAEPSWIIDTANPKANVSNNEGSMFKVGETWTSSDVNKFRVRVDSATPNGFNITVSSL